MRSSLVVKASYCQCTSCNGPGFDPSIKIPPPKKKNILWLLFDFLSMKTDVNVPSKNNKQKNFEKENLFFVGILSATDEKSRVRIRKSAVRTLGSGSVDTKMSRIHNTCTWLGEHPKCRQARQNLPSWLIGQGKFASLAYEWVVGVRGSYASAKVYSQVVFYPSHVIKLSVLFSRSSRGSAGSIPDINTQELQQVGLYLSAD